MMIRWNLLSKLYAATQSFIREMEEERSKKREKKTPTRTISHQTQTSWIISREWNIILIGILNFYSTLTFLEKVQPSILT